MEITLETKVKDLIKFQSDESEILEKQYITDNLENVKEIIIRYKPNKPKTFEEYRRACIFDWDLNSNIDLLQSICKDIGISNEQMFVFIYKCIIFLILVFFACKEEANSPLVVGDKPDPITEYTVESLPGGAKIVYKIN